MLNAATYLLHRQASSVILRTLGKKADEPFFQKCEIIALTVSEDSEISSSIVEHAFTLKCHGQGHITLAAVFKMPQTNHRM